MARIALLLAILVAAQDDPAGLVEKLRSENVTEREEAQLRIKALGKRAVPELEKAALDPDA